MGIVYHYAFHTSICLGMHTAHVPVLAYIGLYLQTLVYLKWVYSLLFLGTLPCSMLLMLQGGSSCSLFINNCSASKFLLLDIHFPYSFAFFP